jgi:hypothetical protein
MVKEISTDELKQALEQGQVAALYDNRGAASFEARHIKGARWLSVPDAAAGVGLPPDKQAMLVFY